MKLKLADKVEYSHSNTSPSNWVDDLLVVPLFCALAAFWNSILWAQEQFMRPKWVPIKSLVHLDVAILAQWESKKPFQCPPPRAEYSLHSTYRIADLSVYLSPQSDAIASFQQAGTQGGRAPTQKGSTGTSIWIAAVWVRVASEGGHEGQGQTGLVVVSCALSVDCKHVATLELGWGVSKWAHRVCFFC